MEIIAHRGYWFKKEEKNTFPALALALNLGYGIETDIRDIDGRLVISHDMPFFSNALYLDKLFDFYASNKFSSIIALNIKSDGLQEKLQELIRYYQIDNYFVFDMSIPDTLGYVNQNMRSFVRVSEFEFCPELMNLTEGVWVDELLNPWVSKDLISKFVEEQKRICIVSSELHARDYLNQWEQIKLAVEEIKGSNDVMICTDKPDEAKRYFNE